MKYAYPQEQRELKCINEELVGNSCSFVSYESRSQYIRLLGVFDGGILVYYS